MSNIEENRTANFIKAYEEAKAQSFIIESINKDYFFEFADCLIERIKELEAKQKEMCEEYCPKTERIKELEQENRIQRRQLNSAFDRGWIPKEKVKEIVKEAIEIIESEQFKVIMGDMTKVGRLRYLLEEELLEESK